MNLFAFQKSIALPTKHSVIMVLYFDISNCIPKLELLLLFSAIGTICFERYLNFFY